MRIDIHVHTRRYSRCSHMSPEEMADAAIEHGLDGVVITEHGQLWGADEIAELRDKYPSIKIFRGVEITVKEGEDILVYGVLDPAAFYQRMPLMDLAQSVKDAGGFMAIAHAYRYRDRVAEDVLRCGLDGIEVMSGNIASHTTERILKLRDELGLTAVAGSDGHTVDSVGMYALEFDDDVSDEADLVRQLKAGSFSLVDGRR